MAKKRHPDELTVAYMLGAEKAKDKINLLIQRNDNLEAMLKQIWYMARRYADGRCTVSSSIVNEVYDKCQKMGIDLGDDSGEKYASDGNLGKWMPDKQSFEQTGTSTDSCDLKSPINFPNISKHAITPTSTPTLAKVASPVKQK